MKRLVLALPLIVVALYLTACSSALPNSETQPFQITENDTMNKPAPRKLDTARWRGRVVTGEPARPLAGARVEIGDRVLLTDAQGDFTASDLRDGTKLRISLPGYQSVTLQIQTTEKSQEITKIALAPVEIRVTVVDETTQKGLPGVRVRSNGAGVNTDINGIAVLTGLPAGATITAKAPGYSPAEATLGDQEGVTLALASTFMQGVVLNPSAKTAVPHAVVLLEHANGAIAPPREADSSGKFALEDFTTVQKIYLKKPGYLLGTFDLKQGGTQEFPLTPFQARGIHLYYGITRQDAERVLDGFKNTELNAVVFDVKEDPGRILWDSRVPLARAIGAYVPRSYTAQDQVDTCRAYKLYCIARVTVFKDKLLAQNRPDLALHNIGGGLLYENESYWTNPANKEVQDYHIALALELAAMGFDEIQLDYIRYPGTRNISPDELGDAALRVGMISNFVQRTANALLPTTAFFSGDVFGLTTAIKDEQGIGQVWEEIVPPFDYISPMMYPSTWRYATDLWGGAFNIRDCADAYACPYELIRRGTEKARERTPDGWTLVRPWLQAYGSDGFGVQEYLAQARGADDAQSDGYLFWNNQGLYPNGLFKRR